MLPAYYHAIARDHRDLVETGSSYKTDAKLSERDYTVECCPLFIFDNSMGSRTPENSDLKKERRTCTFNPLELTVLLDGGRKNTKERKDIGE